MVLALSLAKSGYFGGNPENVMNAPVNIVIATSHYESFCKTYESTYIELNKTEKK